MAYYAAVSSLVQLLEDIIHRDRYENLLLHKQQIASFYEKFKFLQEWLDDYSPKDRDAADFLQRRIRDAAYEAQDIMETQISNHMPQQLRQLERVKKEVNSQQLQELERVKEEVNFIVEELMKIKKSHTTEDLQLNYYLADVGTSNQVSGRNTMVGVEERLITVKDQLCGEPSKLEVVSIVGMGGMGKTTLARNIFDDKLIVYKFDCRAWVTISQNYHAQKVLLDILDSMKVTTNKSSGVGELGEKIYKHLKGRRYLMIMDDMWDTKVWDDMKRILPDDSNGSRIVITTRSCGIHDLLRDLCKEIIKNENFLHVVDEDFHFHPTAARNLRRLCIRCNFLFRPQFTVAREFGSHVRSVIIDAMHWNFLFFGSGLKLLRVLDSTNRYAPRYLKNFLKCFHLRYLAFTEDNIIEIPPSISLLQNLQTLIIKSDAWRIRFCSLPSQIREMPHLRHIMSNRYLHFGCLFFDDRIVGEALSWVYHVRFTNEVVEMIPNLRKLRVSYYQESGAWQKFRIDNLFHLRQLETLNIDFPDAFLPRMYPLPESFSFPLTLKNLSLRRCRIPWKHMTVVGSLPNLQVLKLLVDAFMGEKWEPKEGEFPQLKFLLMQRLKLKHWQAQDTHFPTLEHLKISSCRKLQEIPLEIGEISTLQLVEVNFSELAAKSALKMQEEERNQGNNILQVRVYR